MVLVIMVHNILHLNGESLADTVVMTFTQAAIPCFFMASGALALGAVHAGRREEMGPGAGLKGDINRASEQCRENGACQESGSRRESDICRELQRTGVRFLRFYGTLTAWKVLYLLIYRSFGAPPPGNRDLLNYLFLFGDLPGVNTAHFWFMEAYLMILLLIPVLKALFHRERLLYLYLVGVLFVFENGLTSANFLVRLFCQFVLHKEPFLIGGFAEINPFHFQYSFALFYFLVGPLLYEKRESIPARKAACCTAAGLIGLLLVRFSQYETFRWQGLMVVAGHFWISTLFMAGGLFLLVTGGAAERLLELPPVRAFSAIAGRNTEGIFYLHMPALVLLDQVVYGRLFPGLARFDCAALNFLESLAIALAAGGLTFLFKRLRAGVSGTTGGGRNRAARVGAEEAGPERQEKERRVSGT